jgi:hypothetical protein
MFSLAAVTALAGVFLLVLALDVYRWQEQTVADDASFRAFPLTQDVWRHSTVLPSELVRSTIGATEDLNYREAVRAFFLARPREPGLFPLPELDTSRGEAQIVLTDRFRREKDPLRRAHIGTLLGALALAVSPRQDVEQRVTTLEAAIAYLQEAVRLDPANEDAKFNLESALRRLRSEPPTFETARGGRRAREDESVAGLRDIGGGY